MSEEFKVGDVVVCVNDAGADHIRVGDIGRITKIGSPRVCIFDYKIHAVLFFSNLQPNKGTIGFAAGRFKHLPKADDTFINQMRSFKPAKEKTSVR